MKVTGHGDEDSGCLKHQDRPKHRYPTTLLNGVTT